MPHEDQEMEDVKWQARKIIGKEEWIVHCKEHGISRNADGSCHACNEEVSYG